MPGFVGPGRTAGDVEGQRRPRGRARAAAPALKNLAGLAAARHVVAAKVDPQQAGAVAVVQPDPRGHRDAGPVPGPSLFVQTKASPLPSHDWI